MKVNQKQFISLFILFVLVFSQFAYVQPVSAATIRYAIETGGLNAGQCDSWGAGCTLQHALFVAGPGDEIWVQQGTYTPTTGTDRNATFTIPDGVAVYGGFAGTETLLSQRDPDPANTTLSGEINTPSQTDNSYHVVVITDATLTSILDGFTVTLGYIAETDGNPNGPYGAGIYITNSSPTLNNLIITNNVAGNTVGSGGGGTYVDDSNTGDGLSAPHISNVTFSGNQSGRGGGLFSQNSSPVLDNVIFINNTVPTTGTGGGGANIQTLYAPGGGPVINPSLTNVTFINNSATGGGGMFLGNSTGTITNVTFSGNTANRRGGGLLLEFSAVVITNATFYNNTSNNNLADPKGGGGLMNVAGSPTLNNVTFSGNTSTANGVDGSAMRNSDGSTPVISNSIFWGDDTTEITSDGSGSITISDSVVEGGITGTNIITTDPVLGTLADNGGFAETMALGAGSSAIDTGGVNSACASTDQRGTSRPQSFGCDMGAYEYDSFYTDTTDADFNSGTVGDCEVYNTIGGGALRLDTASFSTCTFTSRIFDADESVDWDELVYTGTTPLDTTIAFETRTGRRFVQDDTWFAWQPVSGTSIASLDGQYLQYRVTLTTTNTNTPTVEQVSLSYNTKSPAVLGSPSGTLTSWNNTFTWTGLNGATYYLLEVYDANTEAQLLRKWYTAASTSCDTDTSCTLSPSEFTSLANGNYKWRIQDQGTYGYGLWTGYTNFTLNVPPPPAVTLNAPTGTLTSWDHAFTWTGLSNATLYLLDVYDANTNAQVHRKWYSNVTAGCDTDTSCSISPVELASLANGDYKWRIRDYGGYGYGPYTGFVNFTLNIPPPPVVTPDTPSGTLTSWNGTFAWTGISGPTLYLVDVYNADTDAQVHRKWYSAVTAGCDTDTSCEITLVSAELANFPNGNYKWRIRDYGGYGYGPYTGFVNFTLNISPPPTVTLDSPIGTLTSWNNTFSWTGISGPTLYLLDVYDANTTAQVHRKWYTAAAAGCDTDTSCSISPPELANLPNGSYNWRIRDYGAYGYGPYTAFVNFVLAIP